MVCGEFGRFDLLNALQVGIGVGAGHGIEYRHDPVEQPAALLQRDQGVFEAGGTVSDGAYLRQLLRHARFDGRLVVTVPNPVERGRLKRKTAGRKEWIARAEHTMGTGRGARGDCNCAGIGVGNAVNFWAHVHMIVMGPSGQLSSTMP
jgi:hypothetical protein